MLTTISVRGYSPFAAFNSAARSWQTGFVRPTGRRMFSRSRLFCRHVQHVVMTGWAGRPSGLPVPYDRSANPVQPVTHCLAALRDGFQQPNVRSATMHTTALNTSRKDAHRINPLISDINKADSLSIMADVIRDMGYMLSQANDEDAKSPVTFGNMYMFCNVLAAALEFESDQVEVAA